MNRRGTHAAQALGQVSGQPNEIGVVLDRKKTRDHVSRPCSGGIKLRDQNGNILETASHPRGRPVVLFVLLSR
jgi:hypothetical protein